ncbi:MAG: DUF2064 domain-containing protein [Gemmatimonadetes bacterium]|nr:DUF2064 domain-containing protein [Gemmatimonadota bacterium]
MKAALALYCREPKPGHVKTRLGIDIGDESASEFYERCLGLLRDEVDAVLDLYDLIICPSHGYEGAWARKFFGRKETLVLPQVDGNLGTKLSQSLSDIRTAGYGPVAFIGSDAPSLPVQFLRDVHELAQRHDIVLGPTDDGGVWTMAVAGQAPSLREIPWSTEFVFERLMAESRQAGISVGIARTWYDVDDKRGLRRAAVDLDASESSQRQELARWIQGIIKGVA